jgi:hypothetical protein
MRNPMAGIRFAELERSAAVLMQFSAPRAAEFQDPTVSAAPRYAEHARGLWDPDRHICYRVVSHFVLRVALAAHLAVNQGGECRYAASFGASVSFTRARSAILLSSE